MLAQNFKTPTELGLTDAQHRALVLTLGALERGELKHVSDDGYESEAIGPYTGHFNMKYWRCGTVCCLGGTAELLGGLSVVEGFNNNLPDDEALNDLFDPQSVEDWDAITPAEAAVALRAYLTTGKADWSHCRA